MVKFNTGSATIDRYLEIKRADEALYKYLGFTNNFSLHKTCHPADVEKLKAAIEDLNEDGMSMVCYRIRRNDGKYRWVLMNLEESFELKGEPLINVTFQDIQSLEQEIADIKRNNAEYRDYFSLLDEMFFSYDPEKNHFLLFNGSGEEKITLWEGNLEDYQKEEYEEKEFSDGDKVVIQEIYDNLRNGKRSFSLSYKEKRIEDNQTVHVHVKGKTVRVGSRKKMVIGSALLLQDSASHSLYQTANDQKDAGTDLFNKKFILEYAANAVEHPKDHTYIAIVDLDNFKHINDDFGHLFGDEVLQVVAGILKESVGDRGVCGRIGGDELMVVLDRVTDNNELRSILRAIRSNVEYYYLGKKEGVNLTTSIGVAAAPDHGKTYEEVFNVADKMLYLAKKKGKNRYIIYTPEIHGNLINQNFDDKVELPRAEHEVIDKTTQVLQLMEFFLMKGTYTYNLLLREVAEAYSLREIDIFQKNLEHVSVGWRKLLDGKEENVNTTAIGGDAQISFAKENDFDAHFDSNGIFVVNSTDKIDGVLPQACQYMKDHGYTRAIFYRMKDCEGYIAYYNSTGGFRSWADSDVANLTYISKIIELAMAVR